MWQSLVVELRGLAADRRSKGGLISTPLNELSCNTIAPPAVALQHTKQNSYWLLGPVFHWLGVVKCRFGEYKNSQT